jgi:sugar lactone lactonase YvrE
MRGTRSSAARAALVTAALLSTVIGWDATATENQTPAVGETRILAQVPTPPGYPEGIAVRGRTVYVAGPATFGTTGKGPSAVFAFDIQDGHQVGRYDVVGEKVLAEHANSSIAFDGLGRLYVLNTQLGIYRLDLGTGAQESYSSPFPDIPPCSAVTPTRCSPTTADAPPIPNDIAFDDAGNAFVSDSMQATIWKVPAGGGAPEIWFQDSRLASPYIGVNGLRINPSGTHVHLTVTTDLNGNAFVYTVPLVASPSAGDLEVLHAFARGDMPDGIAFGRTGLLYVAMATPTRSGVLVLDQSGATVRRFSNPDGSPLAPYDSPANIAFDGHGSIVLTNHAFVSGAAVPSQFSIVTTFVDDKGALLAKPTL